MLLFLTRKRGPHTSQCFCGLLTLFLQAKKRHAIQMAEYEFEISKKVVAEHSLRQEAMLLQLKLSAAEDNLSTSQRAAAALRKQVELESKAGRALGAQNGILRNRLSSMQAACDEHSHLVQQLKDRALRDTDTISTLQFQISRLKEELSLSERTISAAQERAHLAEQTLKQRDALASERAQMQAEMQHYSQDLAKMALETGSAANVKLQQAISEAQAGLRDERRERTNAESRAAAAEARALQLEKETERLEKQIESKIRRIAALEEALRQRDIATPASNKAVKSALDAVGTLVNQLGDSPETDVRPKRRSSIPPSIEASKEGAAPGDMGARQQSSGGLKSGGSQPKGRGRKRKMDKLPRVDENDDEELEDSDGKKEGLVESVAQPRPNHKEASKTLVAPRGSRPRHPQSKKAAKKDLATSDEDESPDEQEVLPAKVRRTTAVVAQTKEQRPVKRMSRIRTVGLWEDKNTAECAFNKENLGAGDLPPAPESKLAANPLQALNLGTIAAASNQVAANAVLKTTIVRPMLGVSSAAQGGSKRRLLGVSAGAAASAMGDTLPASMLFGANFKVPKLQGRIE